MMGFLPYFLFFLDRGSLGGFFLDSSSLGGRRGRNQVDALVVVFVLPKRHDRITARAGHMPMKVQTHIDKKSIGTSDNE